MPSTDSATPPRASVSAVGDEWKPIETAPKDGTPVLLARFDRDVADDDDLGPDAGCVGHWAKWADREGWYLVSFGTRSDYGDFYFPGNGALDDNGYPEMGPTHWSPLPASPRHHNRKQRP